MAPNVMVAPPGCDFFTVSTVVEDKVGIVEEMSSEEIEMLRKLRDIGRYFIRLDERTETFIATPRVAAEYPDL